jgi:hypothetical protein
MNINNYNLEYTYDYILGMETKKKDKYKWKKYKWRNAQEGIDEQIEVWANKNISTKVYSRFEAIFKCKMKSR